MSCSRSSSTTGDVPPVLGVSVVARALDVTERRAAQLVVAGPRIVRDSRMDMLVTLVTTDGCDQTVGPRRAGFRRGARTGWAPRPAPPGEGQLVRVVGGRFGGRPFLPPRLAGSTLCLTCQRRDPEPAGA